MSADLIDLKALDVSPVTTAPFPYMIVPGFLRSNAIAAIEAAYPKVDRPGSFPPSTLKYGPAFAKMLAEIQGPEMTETIGRKLGINLRGRPTMVTVRGMCRATDGKIHTDSVSKLVTVLIYMNGQWEAPGGRLRLLRGSESLENAFAEVPPVQGTLLAFRNQPNAWHGHESFEGPRRAIQLNWVSSSFVVLKEQARHNLSAFVKRLKKVG